MTSRRPHRTPTWRDYARTAVIHSWLVAYLVFYVVVFGPVLWVAARTWDPHRRLARRVARGMYRHCLGTFCGKGLVVDPFDWDAVGPCVIVANHRSVMDMVMLMQMPVDARCWSKGWPFKLPFIGTLMRLCDHHLTEDFNVLPNARDSLADGISLCAFPEGTRSRTGRLGRFRDGAFLLAVHAGVPVVPVAIQGTFECLPPGQLCVFTRNLRVTPLGVLYPETGERAHLHLKREARLMIARAMGQAASIAEAAPPAPPSPPTPVHA